MEYFRIEKRKNGYTFAIISRYLNQETVLNARNVVKTIKTYLKRKYLVKH